jgi:hypothetical protein
MEENKKPFVLGLITARGGSIRLPRKNIKLFCGHPLVAWSIIQSRCSRLIDATVLTTDDDEIASIGEKYGAIVIRRPVMDDDTTAGVPFRMAVEELEKGGMVIDQIVSMLPTSPLKKPSDLDDLIWAFQYHNSFWNNYKQTELNVEENEMGTFSPDREAFLFKNVEDMTNNYNVAYHVRREIADKNWHYSKLAGGWGIAKRDYLMKVWGSNPEKDSIIDANLMDYMFDKKQNVLGYAIEPWQCFETDYDHYFKVCEVLMEEFILKGKGMDVYTRYARNFRKVVKIND